MKVVTFGEIMLRLMPPGFQRFEQAKDFTAEYGGGEANVCVSLANYGLQAMFISKVPNNPIGQCAINSLRHYGVDTSMIARGGERLGIYFAEKGASQRPSKVVYDRAHSSIATAAAKDFDWGKIFAGAQWFHFTGITPALGKEAAKLVKVACREAKKAGVRVSCDLNYRKKLWSTEQASKVMSELMEWVDVCIANEEDAEKVFGIRALNTDVTGGALNHDGYIEVAKKLTERFKFYQVAITLRTSISASVNKWAGMLYSNSEVCFSPEYTMNIVDRIGGGDSFGGGLIYGLCSGFDNQKALNFAVAASCLKHSIEGDYNLVSVSEVETLMKGDGSGRVQR